MGTEEAAAERTQRARDRADLVITALESDLKAGRIDAEVLRQLQIHTATTWFADLIDTYAPELAVTMDGGEVWATCPHCGHEGHILQAFRVEDSALRWNRPNSVNDDGTIAVSYDGDTEFDDAEVIACQACDMAISLPDRFTIVPAF